MKRALITGVSGQDGRFLTKELVDSGYEVFGTSRRQENEFSLEEKLDLSGCEKIFLDNQGNGLMQILDEVQPDLLFNLSGMSSVSESYTNEGQSRKANLEYVENLLEAITNLKLSNNIRIYQASSSEMFGSAKLSPQNELTDFRPVSPYGTYKLMAHNICRKYREEKGLFISCGILFNHESEKRSIKFVTRKITKTVAEIKLGISETLTLGNLDARRDWGFAGDYVKAMQKMLEVETPNDYVIATGKSHSVLEFVEAAFQEANLEFKHSESLKVSSELIRKTDHRNLVGNSELAQNELNWSPKVSFNGLVSRMVQEDLRVIGSTVKQS